MSIMPYATNINCVRRILIDYNIIGIVMNILLTALHTISFTDGYQSIFLLFLKHYSYKLIMNGLSVYLL